MPVVISPDWVQNSNDSFWLSNPHVAPAAGISPLVGFVGTPQRLRTRSGIMEIEGRLAGNDGLGGNKMGADELRTVIFRDKNLAGMLVMDDLTAGLQCERFGVDAGSENRLPRARVMGPHEQQRLEGRAALP